MWSGGHECFEENYDKKQKRFLPPPTVLGRVVREVAFELSPESQFLGQQHA